MNLNHKKHTERDKIFVSLFFPSILVLCIIFIKIIEVANATSYFEWGINPRTIDGLIGILISPLLHSNWEHLFSNTLPLLILGSTAIYFYRSLAYRVFIFIWILDGIGVWLIGRESYHIGASGLVYGIASFIFFSGVLRSNKSLLSLSLFVVAVYGGLIWGMLPYVPTISWESHSIGFLTGIILAVIYKTDGPINDSLPDWYYETDNEDTLVSNINLVEDQTEYIDEIQKPVSVDPFNVIIHYDFKPSEPKNTKE